MSVVTLNIPFIGLCGNPQAGKSTAAEILRDKFGCVILDSGLPLRQIAIDYLGLTEKHVFTQEGKASHVDILNQSWQVRKILGDLGQKFEDMFGEEIIPYMAHQSIKREASNRTYVDPSCRKIQGHYWKRQGGIILEIVNPDARPSPFAFDTYDKSAVDCSIINDGLARGMSPEQAMKDLETKLIAALIGLHFGLAA